MEDKKTIALVSGALRPPHAGHWSMIEKYADLADEVKVIISNPKNPKSIRKTKNGTIITPEMSKAILELFIKRYGLNDKVKVEISEKPSPVTAAFDYVDNKIKNAKVYLGSSKKDDDWKRFRAAPDYFKDRTDIEIVDPQEAAVVPLEGKNGVPFSATQIRDNIDDKDLIKQMMPSKLTSADISKIIEILSATTNESTNWNADFMKQYIDFDKSRIAYLGNMRLESYFGPNDSLCQINIISKDGKDKINVVYVDNKWHMTFNGKSVKEISTGYKALINDSEEFKKLEKKLFSRWEEMKRYPRRMLKNAQISFNTHSSSKRKFSDDELKTMCKERLDFLKANHQ